jgi:hypothetical protein
VRRLQYTHRECEHMCCNTAGISVLIVMRVRRVCINCHSHGHKFGTSITGAHDSDTDALRRTHMQSALKCIETRGSLTVDVAPGGGDVVVGNEALVQKVPAVYAHV